MHPTLAQFALTVGAAFAAGAVNSIAGGGSLLTFPALLAAGVSPTVANATSTVALVPGSASAFWAYRQKLGADAPALLALGVPSVLGGFAGAVLLLAAGDALFARLVPWLILGATVLFVVQEPLAAWTRRLTHAEPLPRDARDSVEPGETLAARHSPAALVGLGLFQVLVAVYGGFFGAGIGIMMLAALGLAGVRGIHRMNALKNFAAVAINGVAAVTFIARGKVAWPLALAMAAGAIVGGTLGARTAQRVGSRVVRRAVVLIGFAIATYMFARQLRGG